jgi:hypothetical protein
MPDRNPTTVNKVEVAQGFFKDWTNIIGMVVASLAVCAIERTGQGRAGILACPSQAGEQGRAVPIAPAHRTGSSRLLLLLRPSAAIL